MPQIQHIQNQDRQPLAQTLGLDNSTARIEIQMLLQHVLHMSRASLLAHPERELSSEQEALYQNLLQRRLNGEPLAYILGEREFFGLTFKVTPATLIPRPDTELIVELAIQHINRRPLRVLDLGTGSGAIACSIAKNCPQAHVTAIDASPAALEIATYNAQQLQLNNLNYLQSNWFSALTGQMFDLIVSNPPYIAEQDPHLSQGDVRFEPITALTAGTDGLDDIRHILQAAPQHLTEQGRLLFEHGYDQAEQVRQLLLTAKFRDVCSERDLAGIERVTGGTKG